MRLILYDFFSSKMQSAIDKIKKHSARRAAEYCGLIFFFLFFAYRFFFLFNAFPLFLALTLFLTFGYILSFKREKRRLLDYRNRYRLVSDAIESLSFALFVALFSLIAMYLQISLLVFSSYFSFSIIGYLIGAFLGENIYRARQIKRLNEKELFNYASNLNKSILLPFNYQFKKRS